jgi:DNA-binding response OmpR family regulator
MVLRNHTIVVIDDTISIRTFLRISLEGHGATFYEAGTAEEGLALCAKVGPDVIVLDLGLPDKDGLEIIRELKRLDGHATPPKIIILSVRKEQRTKYLAYALGADGYLSKPFLMEDLIEMIENTLALRQ